ncbi:MAG: DUF908 domain-containing protein [Oscillospiraceae bacterium]|jgi:hypothetical protein|nr:DUF908 domain-containing protein [Oscillospiraceae bacterium]
MNVTPIGNGNYYIEISGEELRDSDVAELLRRGAPGLPDDAFYEIFPGADGALVFARARRGAPAFFLFPDIEPIIQAARRCDGDCITFLAHIGGAYCLIYYPWDLEPAPGALFEFGGGSAPCHPDYARHIAEHGKLLLGPRALGDLRRLFA